MGEEEEEEMRMRRRRRSSNRDDDDDYDQEEEEEEERVLEWECGLPSADELTPLSQHLIPPELASAFSIKPEPLSTMLDVQRATHKTLSTLLLLLPPPPPKGGSLPTTKTTKTNNLIIKPFSSSSSSTFFNQLVDDVNQSHEEEDPMVVEGDDDPPPGTSPTKDKDGSETRKIRRRRVLLEEEEEEENNTNTNNNNNITEEEEADSNDDHSSAARTLKRPRLVWTPQLHKRFVDVVAHLGGIKNAVPKTIMQLMNVQGLTRENVASHLQKYRLYLKRMQGLPTQGPSSSDPLFASTPVPHSLHEPPTGSTSTTGKQQQHISHPPPPPPPPPPPMPYAAGNMLPMMPVLGHGFGNPAAAAAAAAYQGFEFHSYGMFRDQRREYWSGNRFGPMVSYPKRRNDKPYSSTSIDQ